MTDRNSRLSETLDDLRERQLQAWQRGERLLGTELPEETISLFSGMTP